jgi:hypothetical protein
MLLGRHGATAPEDEKVCLDLTHMGVFRCAQAIILPSAAYVYLTGAAVEPVEQYSLVSVGCWFTRRSVD